MYRLIFLIITLPFANVSDARGEWTKLNDNALYTLYVDFSTVHFDGDYSYGMFLYDLKRQIGSFASFTNYFRIDCDLERQSSIFGFAYS